MAASELRRVNLYGRSHRIWKKPQDVIEEMNEALVSGLQTYLTYFRVYTFC